MRCESWSARASLVIAVDYVAKSSEGGTERCWGVDCVIVGGAVEVQRLDSGGRKSTVISGRG